MSEGAKYIYGEEPVEINVGRRKTRLTVRNTGDRAIQVGSHYHFFEANRAAAVRPGKGIRDAPRHRVGHRRPVRAR